MIENKSAFSRVLTLLSKTKLRNFSIVKASWRH